MRRAVAVGTTAVLLALAGAAYAAVVTCEGGPCQGTDQADTITGSLQSDSIFADDGSDDVDARAGHDFARGAEGDDVMFGGRGEDSLRGNRGYDLIFGGPGDDTIVGGADPGGPPPGGVTVSGGPEESLLDSDSNDADTVYAGTGFERIDVNDGDGDDYVDCGPDGASSNVFADKGDVLENCHG